MTQLLTIKTTIAAITIAIATLSAAIFGYINFTSQSFGGIQALAYCNEDAQGSLFSTSTAVGIALPSGTGADQSGTSTRPHCQVDRASKLMLNVLAVASTSESVINIQLELSDDLGMWLPYVAYLESNSHTVTLTSASGTVFAWTPGRTGSSTLRLPFEHVSARYVRPLFAGVTATSTVWWSITKPEELR